MPIYKCKWCGAEFEGYCRNAHRAKNSYCTREHLVESFKTKVGYWAGKKVPYKKRPGVNVKGDKNPKWRGGRRIDKDGYVLIWKKEHPNPDYHGYVREHRLVIEQSIGRYLEPEEVVHHKDGNKQNNKIENLEIYENGSEHQKHHYPTNKYLKHSPEWNNSKKS